MKRQQERGEVKSTLLESITGPNDFINLINYPITTVGGVGLRRNGPGVPLTELWEAARCYPVEWYCFTIDLHSKAQHDTPSFLKICPPAAANTLPSFIRTRSEERRVGKD